MDLRTASGVVRRHKKVVIFVVLLTAIAAVYVGKTIKPKYESKATWIFISSAETKDSEGKTVDVNPFTSLGNAEAAVSTAVYTVTQSDGWALRMHDAGATGTYEFTRISDVINELTVTDNSVAGAQKTLDTGLQLVKEELVHRQEAAGAPPGSLIGMDILSKSATPAELTGSAKRAMGAVAAIGIVLAVSLAFLLDAEPVVRARRRMRSRFDLAVYRTALPVAVWIRRSPRPTPATADASGSERAKTKLVGADADG
jgi:capsular polysaccharide biosynthesis protein